MRKLNILIILFLINLSVYSNSDTLTDKVNHGVNFGMFYSGGTYKKLNYFFDYSVKYKKSNFSIGAIFGNSYTLFNPDNYLLNDKNTFVLRGGHLLYQRSNFESEKKLKPLFQIDVTLFKFETNMVYTGYGSGVSIPSSEKKTTIFDFNIGFGLKYEVIKNFFLFLSAGIGPTNEYYIITYSIPEGTIIKKQNTKIKGLSKFTISYFF